MATEAWVALFIAICLPLIGFAWANMQSRITKVETEARNRIDFVEASIRKDLNDKHVDLRHLTKNTQTQLTEMLMTENRDVSTKMLRSVELMIELLREPATSEIVARRQIKRNERNEA